MKKETNSIFLKIRLTFTEEALGSQPSDPDIHETYIASLAPTAELSAEEVENIKAQNAENGITVFYKQADGTPCFTDNQIVGMFKESFKMLKISGKEGFSGGKACSKITNYKQAIDGGLFVYPRYIPIDLHGMKMGYCVRSLRASTPMGPRTSIAKSETVPEGSTLEFTVRLDNPKLEAPVYECLDYGERHGLSQWRNSGKGRFVWDLLDESGNVIGGNNEFEEGEDD